MPCFPQSAQENMHEVIGDLTGKYHKAQLLAYKINIAFCSPILTGIEQEGLLPLLERITNIFKGL